MSLSHNKKHYKIGFLGFGSIAKRHLLNTCSILDKRGITYEIDLIRRNKSAPLAEEYTNIISNVFLESDRIPTNYDILFITNPTSLHLESIKQYNNHTKHMFIEKPVFSETISNLEVLNLKKDSTYYVACPLRYTSVLQYLKENIDINDIYSIRAMSSSYLPDWRPNIDYRNVYSAKKDQGGGVSIDLIHEWDYLVHLFGFPKDVLNFRGKFSHLEIDSDDLSIYMGRYNNFLVELHLDYFGKKTIRECQIITKEETIVADIINSEVRYLTSEKTVKFNEKPNSFYIKELEYFFDILEGKETNSNEIEKANKILKITKEAKVI